MKYAYSPQQIREAERPLLDAGEPLMERASFGLYQVVRGWLRNRTGGIYGRRVVVLVGPGNNGGDALFAAAHLARSGAAVTVVCVAPRVHHEGLAAVRASQAQVMSFDGETNADWLDDLAQLAGSAHCIVDGVLGIGASGTPRGIVKDALSTVARVVSQSKSARTPACVVAVDVPSGIDASTGVVADSSCVIPATVTVTFGGFKPGHFITPARELCGEVKLIDLGLHLDAPAVRVLESADFGPDGSGECAVAKPAAASHKYTRGVVGVQAGSTEYPGAGLLVVSAAARSGIGMVRYLGPSEVARTIVAQHPETVAGSGRVQALIVGSGMPATDSTLEAVEAALTSDVPVVIDAGALAVLRKEHRALLGPRHVLTPHAGELSVLLGAFGESFTRETVEFDPMSAAQALHLLTGATVVAKGSTTVITGQDGIYIQSESTARLATAGSGDVLAGIISATLAGAQARTEETTLKRQLSGRPPEGSGSGGFFTDENSAQYARLAAIGVFLHSRAGQLAAGEWGGAPESRVSAPIIARDIVAAIPSAHASLGAR